MRRTFLICNGLLLAMVMTTVYASSQQVFFSRLKPLVAKCSSLILAERQDILNLADKLKHNIALNAKGSDHLSHLAKKYGVRNFKLTMPSIKRLLERVDIVPTSMVLAQAADESAWGRSRFAQEGHNLFGQWCFVKGCGIVPKRRPKGAHYEVQRFTSESDAIASYFHNLNTQRSYQQFRQLRAKLRADKKQLSGIKLAEGLQHYSSRGMKYVGEIQHIIRQYKLE